jgi:Na+-driven multidrug efflux pump
MKFSTNGRLRDLASVSQNKTVIYTYASKIVIISSQLLIIRDALTRISIEQFALLTLLLALCSVWIQFADFGYGQNIHNRKIVEIKDSSFSIVFGSFLLLIAWLLLANVISELIAKFYIKSTSVENSQYHREIVWICIVFASTQSIAFIRYKYLYAINRGYLASLLTALGWLVACCIYKIFLILNQTINVKEIIIIIITPQILIAIFSSLLSCRKISKSNICLAEIKNSLLILYSSLPIFFQLIMVSIAAFIENVVASQTLTSEEIASLGISGRIAGIGYFLSISIAYAILPTYGAIKSFNNSSRSLTTIKTLFVGLFILTIIAALMLISGGKLITIFDPSAKLNIKADFFVCVCGAVFARFWIEFNVMRAQLANLGRYLIFTTSVFVILTFIFEYTLVKFIGANGIPLGYIISALCTICMMELSLLRKVSRDRG